ncbi:dihydropyrimidine dehydrogenase subunit A [Litchfieldella anticariensis FP35 = DSM 16096]|uniref:Dihydropyrimidine dehydrogenase subunit A n=1 Tax=Litchfieldella anticariensis (strain DSM 16096 / CECT 5854 / CIP 108499 / LMG 22089 / FP35) TaxID=1121939 RepID=S2KPB4_LITA3|nr:NAD(P)-dependent oxidoreductase [Halomonas anticariensis]EPC02313.1 dihydropyrimidine dehydrogenase subunit A [Halomonas anticariensis FP35 = DSM 16096]
MTDNLNHLPRVGDTGISEQVLADNFRDLHPPLTERQAIIESQRCLYCYDAPCIEACPSDIDIPRFIRQIGEGNINGAAHTILEQNILGGSCARVCPTEILCEQSCVRNHDAECQPVLIGLLQRHATDHMHFDQHPFARAADSGRHVAVVGAGPAGLACAHRLAMHGHRVTIYEAEAKPGGLNEYGIARYKMTDDFARKEVEFLLEIGGIELRYGQCLGDNLSLAQLHADHDGVFLGLGLGTSRKLGLTGEDAPGLAPATEYIKELRQASDLTQLPLARRCVVIGAGNTAIDMATQMARLGADEVTLVYRRGIDAMSATGHEQEIAKANGVRMLTWARPLQVLLNDQRRVVGMRFEKTQEQDGRLAGTGETFEVAADAVFKAIGQTFANDSLSDPLAAELERTGDKIQVDEHFRTSLPNVYAGGDCIASGQDLTVQAVQHGKLAAHAIHQDLLAKQEAA